MKDLHCYEVLNLFLMAVAMTVMYNSMFNECCDSDTQHFSLFFIS